MKKLLALLLFVCVGCGIPHSSSEIRKTSAEEIQNISMIRLIADSENFHYAKVRIIGFAIIQFEGTAIYLSKEFADAHLSKNAIWLNIEKIEQFKQYDRKYVLVEGIFNKDFYGHLNLFSGAITDISRFEEWIN